MAVDYEVVEDFGQIGEAKGGTMRSLCLISWNKRPAKLDLRAWHEQEDKSKKPGKGITLTDEEAKDLLGLLQKYFDREEA